MNDKVVTIRFNHRELEILNAVVDKRRKYWSDGVGTVIKDLIKEVYKADQEKKTLKSNADCR